MSYEPTIIIKKKDLEKNRKKIEADEYNRYQSEMYKNAITDIIKALNAKTVKFKELEIVIIYPELTSHNAAVRELLDEYKIGYQIDN